MARQRAIPSRRGVIHKRLQIWRNFHMTQSFYTAAPEAHRSEDTLGAYRRFLIQRNGPGFVTRDENMKTFDPSLVRADLVIDNARFNRNYDRLRNTDISEEEMALLAFVKINAAEAYGVEVVTKAARRSRAELGVAADVQQIVVQEEQYHTRLLVGAAGHFEGLSIVSAWRPALSLRLIIGALVHIPTVIYHPVVLSAEIAGVHMFNWMLGRVKTLFRDQPAVRESMERRLIEVLIDEVGHVAFNRVLVGALGRSVARQLAKLIAWSNPTGREMQALGYGRSAVASIDKFDFCHLPDEVRRRAFFA